MNNNSYQKNLAAVIASTTKETIQLKSAPLKFTRQINFAQALLRKQH
jgi:hypothetical protein